MNLNVTALFLLTTSTSILMTDMENMYAMSSVLTVTDLLRKTNLTAKVFVLVLE
jgi:hypothetical protein